jgi:hypothetical protein
MLQVIEFVLAVVLAGSLPSAIQAEVKRLESLIPEEQRKGVAEKEIASALERLRMVKEDLAAGRVELAFDRLAYAQDVLESAAFLSRHHAEVKDSEAFLALWEAEGRVLEEKAARLASADLSGKSALVRAWAELYIHRILPHHRASKMYARFGIPGGLYYLGSARAAASFAELWVGVDDPPTGKAPRFRSLAPFEAELSRSTVTAYGSEDSSTVHHRNFIRLDSALKEARRLLSEHREFGTASALIEARLRLGLIQLPAGSAAPDPEKASYRNRLFDETVDHSLARASWERAVALSTQGEDGRREAIVLFETVIPFYFELLEDPSAGPVPAAVRSEPASGGQPPCEERGGIEQREALGVGPQRRED